jgi:hypothetical protein
MRAPSARATPEAIAVRSAFYAVLNEMPEDKLRKLILELLLAPFTMTTAHRKRDRRRKAVEGKDVDEEKVVSLHQRKNGRKRCRSRTVAVDAAKLAERRKRAAANRKAARQAAKAARAIKGEAAPAAGNGEDVAVTPAMLWQHAERIQPQAPWKAVARELGVRDIHAQHAYRNQSLPPHVGAMAITKFLTLPVPN